MMVSSWIRISFLNERTIRISLGSPEQVRIGIGWGLRLLIGAAPLPHRFNLYLFITTLF